MQRSRLRIEKRDLRDIALGALGGFLLVLIPLAARDLGTAISVGSSACPAEQAEGLWRAS